MAACVQKVSVWFLVLVTVLGRASLAFPNGEVNSHPKPGPRIIRVKMTNNEIINLRNKLRNLGVIPRKKFLEQHVPVLKERVPTLNQQVPTSIQQVPTLNQQVPTLNQQVPTLNHQVPTLNHQVPTLNHQVPTLNHQVPTLNHQVPTLNHQVPTLNQQEPRTIGQPLPLQNEERIPLPHVLLLRDLSEQDVHPFSQNQKLPNQFQDSIQHNYANEASSTGHVQSQLQNQLLQDQLPREVQKQLQKVQEQFVQNELRKKFQQQLVNDQLKKEVQEQLLNHQLQRQVQEQLLKIQYQKQLIQNQLRTQEYERQALEEDLQNEFLHRQQLIRKLEQQLKQKNSQLSTNSDKAEEGEEEEGESAHTSLYETAEGTPQGRSFAGLMPSPTEAVSTVRSPGQVRSARQLFAPLPLESGGGGSSSSSSYSQNSPSSYNFEWTVADPDYGNNYGHREAREGDETRGAYYVTLPDGRLQRVDYYVSGDSGFVAEVSYEGEARYSV